jgi:hypothetical protein
MRAARISLCLALVAGGCSLSLDGDHFLGAGQDAGAADAGRSSPDARAPAHRHPDAGAEEDPPDICGDTCGGPDCDLSCPDRPCDCELDCPADGNCKPKCEHHDCAIDCRGLDKCEATCKDSDCTIDCTGTRECDHVKCEDGSGCLLDCTGTERCQFDACDGDVTSCADGLLACNRDCP